VFCNILLTFLAAKLFQFPYHASVRLTVTEYGARYNVI